MISKLPKHSTNSVGPLVITKSPDLIHLAHFLEVYSSSSYMHLIILYTSYIHLEVSRSYMKLFPYRRGFNMTWFNHQRWFSQMIRPLKFLPPAWASLETPALPPDSSLKRPGRPATKGNWAKIQRKKWWMNVGFGLVDWFKNPSKNPQQKIMKRYSERPSTLRMRYVCITQNPAATIRRSTAFFGRHSARNSMGKLCTPDDLTTRVSAARSTPPGGLRMHRPARPFLPS